MAAAPRIPWRSLEKLQLKKRTTSYGECLQHKWVSCPHHSSAKSLSNFMSQACKGEGKIEYAFPKIRLWKFTMTRIFWMILRMHANLLSFNVGYRLLLINWVRALRSGNVIEVSKPVMLDGQKVSACASGHGRPYLWHKR